MIPFEKYQGCGNDVLIIKEEFLPSHLISTIVPSLCNRYKGVGADGVIIYKKDPLEMLYINADGSEATMCGNGLRCFAKYCFDHQLWKAETLAILTGSGKRCISLLNTDPFIVQVDMGKPCYACDVMHIENFETTPISITIEDQEISFYPIYTTTMHAVVFVSSLQDEIITTLGKKLSQHPIFYHQTNVTFVNILRTDCLEIITYERGVGFTQGCGSGACAAAVIAHQHKQCNATVQVLMKGGSVDIHIQDDTIYMCGSAERIMEGIYYDA